MIWYSLLVLLVIVTVVNKARGFIRILLLLVAVLCIFFGVYGVVTSGVDWTTARFPGELDRIQQQSDDNLGGSIRWVKEFLKEIKYKFSVM